MEAKKTFLITAGEKELCKPGWLELMLVGTSSGKIVGYTIGNDMSGCSIER